MKDWLLYIVVNMLISLFYSLPFSVSYRIGTTIGLLIYMFDKKHRRMATSNLKVSFKDKPYSEITAIARQVFRNVGSMAVEIAFAFKGGKGWVEKSVRISGRENVEQALKKGRGVILMTAHLGNWEVGAAGYGKRYPFNIVVRPIDNPYLDGIASSVRAMYDSGIIAKKSAFRHILKALKRNETVGILMDQNVLLEEGVFVKYFGRDACTSPVISLLALRTGAAVLPCFTIREAPGKVNIIIEKAVEVMPSGDVKNDIKKYTQIFTDIIESYVRKYPDQWFWLHNRWKTVL